MFSTFVGLGRFISCQRPDIILFSVIENNLQHGIYKSFCENMSGFEQKREHISRKFDTPKSPRALRALFF